MLIFTLKSMEVIDWLNFKDTGILKKYKYLNRKNERVKIL
jgi:hypothetical protein